MADIRIKCGKCDKALKVPDKYAGRVVACPACKQKLRVPEPAIIEAALVQPLDEKELPAAAKPRKKPSRAAEPETGSRKLGAGEWIVAIVLAPVGLIVSLLWALRKEPKWLPMLGASAVFTCAIGGALYSKWDDLMEWYAWQGQEERITNDPNQYWSPESGMGGPEAGFDAQAFIEAQREAQKQRSANIKPPSEDDLLAMSSEIQRACRANVGVTLPLHGDGSGVIMQIEGNKALILTNRHVIDASYEAGGDSLMLADIPELQILYVDSSRMEGRVIWVADNRVDLALIEARCPTDKIAAGDWSGEPTASIGQEVFTVGNPVGYGWTYTTGKVSGVRNQLVGDKEVPVFQVDATINPGNSGGGLYSKSGKLLGINTYIVNPGVAQNMGFAIRAEYLNELQPPKLKF